MTPPPRRVVKKLLNSPGKVQHRLPPRAVEPRGRVRAGADDAEPLAANHGPAHRLRAVQGARRGGDPLRLLVLPGPEDA